MLVAVLGLAAYSNTLDAPFVFDDSYNIVENQRLKSLSNIPSMFTTIEGPIASRPLMLATFALNYAIGGQDTTSYRLVNIALHVLNGVLLYFLVVMTARLPGRKWEEASLLALFSSLLFVAHPIQTESVTYIVTRSMPLATAFYFLGTMIFIKAVSEEGRKSYYAIGLFVVSLMGMASREDFVTFPLMLLLYDYFFVSGSSLRKVLRNYRLHLPALVALPYLVFLVTSASYGRAGSLSEVTPYQYLLTQLNVHWTYLRLLIAPLWQNVDYDYPLAETLFELPTILSFIGYLGLWACALYFLRKKTVVSFLILWFLITILPSSSVVPLDDLIFEHRLYLPSAGILVLASTAIFTIAYKHPGTKIPLTAGLALVVLALAFSSYSRNAVWLSEVSLWEDTVRKSPGKARPHHNLGAAYKKQDRPEDAMREFQAAVRIEPDSFRLHESLGLVYRDRGMREEAIREFQAAIRLNPDFTDAYNNLGLSYMRMGLLEKAIELFQDALSLDPQDASAHFNLGYVYSREGLAEKAISHYSTAIRIKPDYTDAHINLGSVYQKLGKLDMAEKEYRAALKSEPDNDKAHNNLGAIYVKQGLLDEAVKEFTILLELKPMNAVYHLNLGIIYEKNGEFDKAIYEYQEALSLDPNLEPAKRGLERFLGGGP
jgi:tetratricopeptide (TPR) repeat protein